MRGTERFVALCVTLAFALNVVLVVDLLMSALVWRSMPAWTVGVAVLAFTSAALGFAVVLLKRRHFTPVAQTAVGSVTVLAGLTGAFVLLWVLNSRLV